MNTISRINRSDSITNLAIALAKAQGKLRPIKPESTMETSKFRHQYATMYDISADLRPLLTELGLVLVQAPLSTEDRAEVETMIIHAETGEWMSFVAGFPMPNSSGPQAFGSAFSYLSRYAIRGAMWLVFGDDDGAAAENAFNNHRSGGWQRREEALAKARVEIAACDDRVVLETWWNGAKGWVGQLDLDASREIMDMVSNRNKALAGPPAKQAAPVNSKPATPATPAPSPAAKAAPAPAPSKPTPPPPPPVSDEAWFAADFLTPGGK